MGICSSKQATDTKGTPVASPTPPDDDAAKQPAGSISTAAADDDTTQEYPHTPGSAVKTDGDEDSQVCVFV